jgi:hypothetical protein
MRDRDRVIDLRGNAALPVAHTVERRVLRGVAAR